MVEITSDEDLQAWLKDKPAEFAQVIAARAALRALPYGFSIHVYDVWIANYSVALFRAIAISWAARSSPAHDIADAAASAGNAAAAAGRTAGAAGAVDAARAAYVAAFAATYTASDRAAYAAAYAAAHGVNAFGAGGVARATFWHNISHDCDWLETYSDQMGAAEALTRIRLWPDGESRGWRKAWDAAIRRLTELYLGWQVWIDWYNRRIEGHDAAFDIPGDIDRIEDKAVLALVAKATDEDLWDKGAAYVNAKLQGWIDEARVRAKLRSEESQPEEPPTTPTDPARTIVSDTELTTAAIAVTVASPIAILSGTQLDAIPNAEFDAQTDQFDVSGSIGDLQDLVDALLDCLPDNAPKIFAANLKVYARQLARPEAERSLNSLDMMHDAIRARFEDEPELYDVGVTKNIENYLKGHGELLRHFRKVAERKAMIAAITMDEGAATGPALADPVNAVHAATRQLAEAGGATERFVEAIAEQKRMNDELAFHSETKPPAGFVKRHVLQLYGFYERIIGATSNSMSVVNGFSEFVGVVATAIRALRGFLGLP